MNLNYLISIYAYYIFYVFIHFIVWQKNPKSKLLKLLNTRQRNKYTISLKVKQAIYLSWILLISYLQFTLIKSFVQSVTKITIKTIKSS